MGVIALRPEKKYKDYTFQPYVSILIPTYNEKVVICDRIENLIRMDYPKNKYEIIIVDSGSSDGTSQIVDDIMNALHIPGANRLPVDLGGVRIMTELDRRGRVNGCGANRDRIMERES
jgi:glycosyltransferase involved in cell wall biosynthesis